MASANYGILGLRYNQDFGCFSVGLQSGMRIYNVNPLVEKLRLDQDLVGSVGNCEMLYRSNLIAIVSGGNMPKFAENTVLIWDDTAKKFVLELTFALPVISVRLRRDKIICILRSEIHIFRFPNNPEKIVTLSTRDNPRGLCEVNTASDRQIMVYPGVNKGTLQIKDLSGDDASSFKAQAPIKAHENDLACLAISQNGNKCATASTKGTLIRVFDTLKRTLLVELRRGMDTARLYSINFSLDSEYLCVSSDKGTVHVFALEDQKLNKRSKLPKIGLFNQYSDSQWGICSFTVPAEVPCICAFNTQQNSQSIVAICVDGKYYKHSFSDSGHCNREEYDVFMEISGEDL
ncbi:WD repeat domain phosphoinositide-interacting protein 4-like [Paramacrobiotus metropolitanus]|uniref:WD repeat domain phosphoinositide-interacting protein 4-like n=1 Tax=Paramacrobiotus metropolitanus TaxID=2943436 RepID=UPI0024459E3C|nr:WD repeat domain phosphoinositide-interacting protein 4-like [Paramacrobiotus metropolitanus]